jgi:hypothetical protein
VPEIGPGSGDNRYLVTEEITGVKPALQVRVFVQRFDRTGRLTGVVHVPLDGMDVVPRDFIAVTGEGIARVLVPTDSGVKINEIEFATPPKAGRRPNDNELKGLGRLLRTTPVDSNVAGDKKAMFRDEAPTLEITVPTPPITRDAVLQNARAYLAVNWVMARENFEKPGVENSCEPTQAKFWMRPRRFTEAMIGTTIGPMPYRWGGDDTPATYRLRIEWAALAGSICTCRDATLNYCLFPDSAGVDCSGFVSRAWGIDKRGTSGLLDVAHDVTSVGELKPGDAFNWPGRHIRLVVGAAPGAAVAYLVLHIPAERSERLPADPLPRCQRERRCRGEATMKQIIPFLLACLFAVVTQERAHAISREQDTVRDVTNLFKAPTILPPNNAVRPNFNGTRNGAPVLQPFQRDEPPDEQSPTEKVAIGYYPWVVALVENHKPPQEGYVCAGVIVAPNWALTAAHCTFSWARRWPVDAEAYVITETAALASPGPRFAVTKIIPHPDYDPRLLVNDVALVRFDTKGAEVPPPIQLEGPPIQDQLGEIGQIVGWGVSNVRLAARQELEFLQIIQVNVLSDGACFNARHYSRFRGKGIFCARSLLQYHDTCYRFGGAPIVMRDLKGERYLSGLVSWPAGCSPDSLRHKPYLDVQVYVPWVKATIKDNTQVAR